MILSTNPYKLEQLQRENKLNDKKTFGVIAEAQSLMTNISNAYRLIMNVYGRAADKHICQAINVVDYSFEELEGDRFMGIIAFFSVESFQEFLRQKTVPKKIQKLTNHIIKIIHREIKCLRGRIYSYKPGCYYAVWRYEDEVGSKAENPPSIDHDDMKRFFKQKMTAKAEIAFSSIFTAIFKVKVFIREYMHYKHNKINFKAEHVVGFSLHAGTGFEGLTTTASKSDPVICGTDLTLARKISDHNDTYKSDLMVTEFVHELLSVEVVLLHPDQEEPARDRPVQN